MNHCFLGFFFVTKMAAYANKVYVYACLFVAKPNENIYYDGLIHSILYKKKIIITLSLVNENIDYSPNGGQEETGLQ